MFKKLRFLPLVIAVIMLLVSCGSSNTGNTTPANSQAPAAQQNAPSTASQAPVAKSTKDTLIVAITSEPPNADPHNNTHLVSFFVQKQVYDTLIVQDENGEIVPNLAERWEIIDDTTVRFFLRDDVYFHNGDKLTAEDVRYNIQRATELPSSRSVFSAFDGEGTAVVDDLTIDIKTHEPYAPIFNYLASSRGDIASKRAIEEIGEESFGHEPVGTGPFVFDKWVSGDRLELVRNDNYWGHKPEYERMVVRFIPEAANRTIELETGGADIILNVAVNDKQRLLDNPQTGIVDGPAFRCIYFTFNQNYEPFNNLKFRQAVAHALDLEAIVESVWMDTGQVADGHLAPTVFAYKSIGVHEYNPEKAKALLAEAGFPNGTKIEMLVGQDRAFIDICEIAQNMLGQVGIEVELQILESAASTKMTSEGTYPFGLTSSSPGTGDPDHGLMIFPSNYTGALMLRDERFDDILTRGKATFESEARKEVYAELLQLNYDEVYTLPVCYTDLIYGIRSNVQGFRFEAGSRPDLKYVTFSE